MTEHFISVQRLFSLEISRSAGKNPDYADRLITTFLHRINPRPPQTVLTAFLNMWWNSWQQQAWEKSEWDLVGQGKRKHNLMNIFRHESGPYKKNKPNAKSINSYELLFHYCEGISILEPTQSLHLCPMMIITKQNLQRLSDSYLNPQEEFFF